MLCECGCGGETKLAAETNRRYGHEKGKPLRFIRGHNTRGMTRVFSEESRSRMSAGQLSRFQDTTKHPRWRGGVTKHGGYVKLYVPDHPRASRGGYVKRSILIAERALGRYLKDGEIVHHFNEVKSDDRNNNLLICTKEYHDWLHGKMRGGLNHAKVHTN